MNRRWKRGSGVVLLLAAAALVAPACVENESSLFIRGCMVPSEDACIVEASEDALLRLGSGFLDVNLAPSYSCALLVGNQLVAVGNDVTLRTETSRVFIHTVDVDVADAATGQLVSSFSSPASATVDPAQGASPGYAAVGALLLDVNTAASVAGQGAELLVTVVLHGRTLGGTEVQSAPWQYSIGVCSGCTCADKSATCTMPAPDLKPDCLRGRDGHCSFIGTNCG